MEKITFNHYRQELSQTFVQAYTYLDNFLGVYNALQAEDCLTREARRFSILCLVAFKEAAVLRCARFFDTSPSAVSLNQFLAAVDRTAGTFKMASAKEIRDQISADRRELAVSKEEIDRVLVWRNERIAHQFTKNLADPEQVYQDFPLAIGEFRALLLAAREIINKYSQLYDGNDNPAFVPTNETLKSYEALFH